MQITRLNFDDIIRVKKREALAHGKKLDGIVLRWGSDGLSAMREFYGSKVTAGFRFMGAVHHFDGKDGEVLIA